MRFFFFLRTARKVVNNTVYCITVSHRGHVTPCNAVLFVFNVGKAQSSSPRLLVSWSIVRRQQHIPIASPHDYFLSVVVVVVVARKLRLKICGIRRRGKDEVAVGLFAGRIDFDRERAIDDADYAPPGGGDDYRHGGPWYGGDWYRSDTHWQYQVFSNGEVRVHARPHSVVFQYEGRGAETCVVRNLTSRPYLFAVALRGNASVMLADLR